MGKQDPGELILPEEAHKDWGGVPEHSLQHCYNQEKETTQSPIKSKMDRFLLILRTDQVEPCPTELWQSGGMTARIVLTKVRHRARVYGPAYVNTGRADLCCPTWMGGCSPWISSLVQGPLRWVKGHQAGNLQREHPSVNPFSLTRSFLKSSRDTTQIGFPWERMGRF